MNVRKGSGRARWHEVVQVTTAASVESGEGSVTLRLHTGPLESEVHEVTATEGEVRDLIASLKERLAWIARTGTGLSVPRCPRCKSQILRKAAHYGRHSGHLFCSDCHYIWHPSIAHCSVCGEPAHPSETDDDDRCGKCRGGAA